MQKLVSCELGLTGEPDPMAPKLEAFEEPTIGPRYAINLLREFAKLAFPYGSQLHRGAHGFTGLAGKSLAALPPGAGLFSVSLT
jgi:hypothetical protein